MNNVCELIGYGLWIAVRKVPSSLGYRYLIRDLETEVELGVLGSRVPLPAQEIADAFAWSLYWADVTPRDLQRELASEGKQVVH